MENKQISKFLSWAKAYLKPLCFTQSHSYSLGHKERWIQVDISLAHISVAVAVK